MGFNVLKVKGLLAENRKTQKDLAEFLGVSEVTISSKMKGSTKFTADEAGKIATWLNAPIDIFFTKNVS